MTTSGVPSMRMAYAVHRTIWRPRICVPPAAVPWTTSPLAKPAGAEPSRTTTGLWVDVENPGWVAASIVRVSVTAGSWVAGMITCGAGPGMSNSIRSGPGVAFAVASWLRSVLGPESAVDLTTSTGFAPADDALAARAAAATAVTVMRWSNKADRGRGRAPTSVPPWRNSEVEDTPGSRPADRPDASGFSRPTGRDRHRPAARHGRGQDAAAQPDRERPGDPTDRSRLRPSVSEAQRHR